MKKVMQEMFQIGVIASTHGISGEVKVFPTTDEPEKFRKLKTVLLKTDKEEQELAIRSARFFKNMIIVKFREFDNINQVERLRGAGLWVTREQAAPLYEDEYYRADLIGLRVLEEDGAILGELTDILETGANDVYEVTAADGKKILLPAIRECIREVDLERGRVMVHLMDGLLEANS